MSEDKHAKKESVPEDYRVPKVWAPKDVGGTFGAVNRPDSGARYEKELSVGDHPIQLYSLGTPNGHKVTIMLEELGVEYDAWFTDIIKDLGQFSSGFVAINPNSKIPSMVDRSDPSAPVNVFESAHILLYLAEKYGKFMPKDPAGRVECLNWLFWQAGTAPYIGGGFGHFYNYAPRNYEYAIDRFSMETKRQLDLLDKKLQGKDWVCGGDEPTIADFAIFPWVRAISVFYGAREFLEVESFKNLIAWCDRLEARPAVARGLRVNGFGPDAVRDRHSAADFA